MIATEHDLAAAIQYLQGVDIGAAGDSVLIDVGADNFIFTQGDATGANTLDQLVKLVGVQGDALIATTNTAGADDIFLA